MRATIIVSVIVAFAIFSGPSFAQTQQSQGGVCMNPNSAEAFQACIADREKNGRRSGSAKRWCEQNNNGCK